MNSNTQEQAMGYMDWNSQVNINSMVGKIFTRVSGGVGSGELVFENDTERFVFFHYQNCCECVDINDIVGDLQDLVGEPLLIAEEVSGATEPDEEHYESYTYTFYKFATRRGYVDVRWLGESNGYYSESVSLGHELRA
jgi:hypothetical protein